MMVQIDTAEPCGPPQFAKEYPERFQIMIHVVHEPSLWADTRALTRWLLHVDGRVFATIGPELADLDDD